jgi:hypothetical protein
MWRVPMKSLWVSIVFFLFSFLYFSTCVNEDNNSVAPAQKSKPSSLAKDSVKDNKNWPKEIYDSVYGKLVMDTSKNRIIPNAAICG